MLSEKSIMLLCPYSGCIGKLTIVMEETTTVGYFGLDRNTHREKFKCNLCKKVVKRAWQWDPDGETLHD